MLPNYPNPPKFDHTKESIIASANKIIADTRSLEDSLVANIKPEDATFENVLIPRSEDENSQQLGSYITFYKDVSADKELRVASTEATKILEDFGIESAMREDVFQLISAVYKGNKVKSLGLDPESDRYLEKNYKGYVRNGLDLPKDQRETFMAIKKQLSILQTDFSTGLGEENGFIWFTPAELDGIPQSVLDGLEKGEGENEGKVKLTFKYPDYFPAMKNVKNPEVRKKIFLGNENKCNQNAPLLKEAVELRDQAARMLGFASHAEYQLDIKMAKTPAKVMEFLNDLKAKLSPGGSGEIVKMKEVKADDLQKQNLTNNGKYYIWDHNYYHEQLLKSKYEIDQEQISQYFPLDNTIASMFNIFETLFGLEFIEVTDDTKNVWHPDTKQFRVYNEKSSDCSEQTFVGWLYLDLHPRDGKYAHAANFNIQPGFTDKNGTRHYPATALVCNFSKPTPKTPSMLKFDEVVTLFHELGHGIHNLVSKTHYSRFHGTSTVGDFVEAPSQMLENWCWALEELKGLSKHYETGEPIPEDLALKLIATKHVNGGLYNLRQLHFGLFDMRIHNLATPEEAKAIVPGTEYNIMRSEIALLDPPEENPTTYGHGEATFGHLMGGYDAGYYGYLWSQVFSTDMFYSAFKANPMDPVQGRRYRHMILEKGGSRDEMESLKEFLGREPNSDAFLDDLGLKK